MGKSAGKCYAHLGAERFVAEFVRPLPAAVLAIVQGTTGAGLRPADTRLMPGLPTGGTSGTYRCYRTSLLEQVNFDSIRSRGYSF